MQVETPIIKRRMILRILQKSCKPEKCSYQSQMGTPASGRSAPLPSDLRRMVVYAGDSQAVMQSTCTRKKLGEYR